ncbi:MULTISPECIES: thermonuclease family protein [Ruegeria]|uniref:thermonuclease family protein n=1 Tax=Ruegeria TaxID=97050 RepID=UPI00147EF4F1|nr:MULTISPECIES: thermonuclease family protein [Ruegeria]NOD49614.1 thermonuclease family protein [Ruegeria sp. HKCCD5849]NOD54032.1 thermonuclease family protein [Ruegeria sp. HKCCD5851]NOD69942.1 thermonuclease family protein [Ruegeria sp. HKCCD7303]NOD90900.1 thermonuclease family protein [Ruegeria sp. HKCCD4318]NOE16073.1 thermonuclease family protein [Ruegeria sp. HKCCD4318-2]
MKRLLFLSAALASLFIAAVWIEPARKTKTLGASEVIAVDGDTIDHGDDRYRLIGFDTPETFRAQCDAERALGLRAKDRLTELINFAGVIELEIELHFDVHDRFLALGRVSGQNVGAILISEGLARPYSGGKRQSWCG